MASDDERERDDSERGPSKEEKQMAMFCHLGNLLGHLIIPLIIWIIKKDESRFVDRHGKEAVNFAITVMIAHLIGPFTACILNLVVFVLSIIWTIQAAMAASRGESYQYPLCIRMIT